MIQVSAKETLMRVGKYADTYRYVLAALKYNTLDEDKVINEAALRTGLPKSVVRGSWDGLGEVIKVWATEGHSCPIPGLGHMRFGIRATSVESTKDVSKELITSRRVIFTPSVSIKEELAKTSISITCYDKNGKKVETVVSKDDSNIEVDDGSTETGTTDGDNTGSGEGGDNTSGGGSQTSDPTVDSSTQPGEGD